MDEQALEELFETIANRYGISPEGSKQIFTLLVKTTLKYRDMLVKKGEPPLTVQETRQALDELLSVIKQRRFPPKSPPRIKCLVTLWYGQLKIYLYH